MFGVGTNFAQAVDVGLAVIEKNILASFAMVRKEHVASSPMVEQAKSN